ncbi:MAG: alpha/beta hydrolase [Hymenobacter sp.]|nr:MAG: alpha/beta hydrolase [Hymenobacter sp.]
MPERAATYLLPGPMPAASSPAIVFLHGYLESPAIWPAFIGETFADCQVLTPALPGYDGASVASDYGLEAAAEAVRAELAAAGVGRAVLVGHSMGGYVALAFAEKYPGLVAGLGLFHSSALPDTTEDTARRARNRTFLEEQGVAAFADEFLQPQLSPTHRESLHDSLAQLQQLAAAVPLAVALGNLDAMAQRPDRRAVLEKATYPVLFIAGKDDRAVPPEKTHEESLLPDYCTVLWLAGVGHLGFIERPTDTRRAVRQLLEAAFSQ